MYDNSQDFEICYLIMATHDYESMALVILLEAGYRIYRLQP